MNILLLSNYFPPEIGSAAQVFYELSKQLSKRGHNVSVVTTLPRKYNLVKREQIARKRGEKGNSEYLHGIFTRESFEGITVIRIIPISFMWSNIMLFRGLEHFIQPILLLAGSLFTTKPDVVLAYSPPPQLGIAGHFVSKLRGSHLIVNIQDIYPEALIDMGIIHQGILKWLIGAFEKMVYRVSDFVTVHSEGNRDFLLRKGAKPQKVKVIYNWVDLQSIRPQGKNNEYRQKLGLNGKFVVTYAGIMSFSQDLETIVESAEILNYCHDMTFLLVGDGPMRERLTERAAKKPTKNLIFLPFQSMENYPALLSASDACLVSLKKETTTPVVPKKLLDIMSAGRPVVAVVPLHGDVPKIVERARCGICIEPENPRKLADTLLALYANPELATRFGQNGRRFAEKHFAAEDSALEYEALFKHVVNAYACP